MADQKSSAPSTTPTSGSSSTPPTSGSTSSLNEKLLHARMQTATLDLANDFCAAAGKKCEEQEKTIQYFQQLVSGIKAFVKKSDKALYGSLLVFIDENQPSVVPKL